MNKVLKQVFAGKDSPKATPVSPCKDKKWGGAITVTKESGQLSKEQEAKHQPDSEVVSELESLSESHSEVGKCKGGQ
jgi:hypothetical protein